MMYSTAPITGCRGICDSISYMYTSTTWTNQSHKHISRNYAKTVIT